jgi:hypothetical protein
MSLYSVKCLRLLRLARKKEDQSGEDAASRAQLYVEYYPNDKKFGHAHENEQAPAYLKA